jgi:predicted  nucleic acid-binding Zn-ribbon protein
MSHRDFLHGACCPHAVERHAYNGCADCGCNVRWDEHPNRDSDTSPAGHEALEARQWREVNRQLAQAHRKVGAARKIVEDFWARTGAHEPYDRDNAWAMHVALVQLAELLKRSGK